jgi:hypothetical protein
VKVHLHELVPSITNRYFDEPLQVVDDAGVQLGSFVTPDQAACLVAAGVVAGTDHAAALTPLVAAVRTMRQHQRDYFKTRSKELLIASKQSEREVDRLLAELDGHGGSNG